MVESLRVRTARRLIELGQEKKALEDEIAKLKKEDTEYFIIARNLAKSFEKDWKKAVKKNKALTDTIKACMATNSIDRVWRICNQALLQGEKNG